MSFAGSTVPVAFGEKVVIRIFDPTILLQDVQSLGLTPEQRVSYERLLKRPHGTFILHTGSDPAWAAKRGRTIV